MLRRVRGGRVGRSINDTLSDTFTERTRTQSKSLGAKKRVEKRLTKRTCGVGETANGKSTGEFVDGRRQVLRGQRSAKSGIRDACALEILTLPCGGVGVGD